ncbi:LLM class flavin-dependent oxidoreductase [Pseudonocardia bannensis]|uniref:LLM class flavin-dependent oxidoreductase n=1 Tax=Pseudonocardia bannensis TaxID=630973 RepID=A0A848DJE4_9PSEU|nr:LLM class flavin-dependent oxidoreductase [Pseudonocardia bannensis]
MTLSCAFATSDETHEHVRIAEGLGYARAFLYDSPALYSDPWVQACRAADLTERIVLGPGALVPSLRHPAVNAASIATLVSIAGADRVCVAFGSGFSGRLLLGQRPMKWADVREYVRTVRVLLRGEQTEWEGRTIQMLHPQGFGAPRPIEVPILLAVGGPKGAEMARGVADGVICAPAPVAGFDWTILSHHGTVLDEGEDPNSERVIAAAGSGATMVFHFMYEHGLLDRMPGGEAWAAAYDALDPDTRHLAMHDRHLIAVTEMDRPFIDGDVLTTTGMAMTPAQLREKLAQLESAGVTEIAHQASGPDVPRELEAFAKAAQG